MARCDTVSAVALVGTILRADAVGEQALERDA